MYLVETLEWVFEFQKYSINHEAQVTTQNYISSVIIPTDAIGSAISATALECGWFKINIRLLDPRDKYDSQQYIFIKNNCCNIIFETEGDLIDHMLRHTQKKVSRRAAYIQAVKNDLVEVFPPGTVPAWSNYISIYPDAAYVSASSIMFNQRGKQIHLLLDEGKVSGYLVEDYLGITLPDDVK